MVLVTVMIIDLMMGAIVAIEIISIFPVLD